MLLVCEDWVKFCREKFFRTNKCKHISLIVGIELPVWEGKRVCLCSISNANLF